MEDNSSIPLSRNHLTVQQLSQYKQLEESIGEHDDKIHLLSNFFSITRLVHPAWIGSFSWNATTIKQRWLLKTQAIAIKNNWVTPPQIARAYLTAKYGKKRRRVNAKQYDAVIAIRKTPPMFARSGVYGEMVYMDIKSAYWSIVRSLGWDVDYFPNQWLASQSDCHDFPFADNRVARNSLLSVGLPNKGMMWSGSKFITTAARNSLVNIMVWNLAQDILNGVAADMVSIGAVYVNVDGFILPAVHEPLSHAIAESWGLSVNRKGIGQTEVVHIGKYKVGDKETSHYRFPSRSVDFKKIDETVNRGWLRPQVCALLSRRFS